MKHPFHKAKAPFLGTSSPLCRGAALLTAAALCVSLLSGCSDAFDSIGGGARWIVSHTTEPLFHAIDTLVSGATPTPVPTTAPAEVHPEQTAPPEQELPTATPIVLPKLVPTGEPGSYSYHYVDSCYNIMTTSLSIAKDGSGILTKSNVLLPCPLTLSLSSAQVRQIQTLFQQYSIESAPSVTSAETMSNLVVLVMLGESGAHERQVLSANYYSSETGKFFDALENLYDTFGSWSFTEAQPNVLPVTDFSFVEQTGNHADRLNLANELSDFSISESTLQSEQIDVNANHMQYRYYEDGSSGTYYLTSLTDADMLVLASILARYDVWSWGNQNDGSSYLSGGDVPSDQHYVYLLVEAEGGQPQVLSLSENLPENFDAFRDELLQAYDPF